MTAIGYTLSSEEHPPRDLVANAARAEEAGLQFLTISDHYHPWVSAQGHSPAVWPVLGAVAASTERMRVGVGVTCPIQRIHPAVVAQQAATTSLLFGGRFFLGVGTGEALNEHIVGLRWPPPDVRLDMLDEAVGILRALWTGETLDHRGAHYTVENARLFDPPADAIPVIVSAFGPKAAARAAALGDGLWGHGSDAETLERYEEAGGTGPRYAQVNLCWAEDEAEARKTVHHVWPNGGVKGPLSQDLPTWSHFEAAAEMVTEEDATSSVPCGPDPQPVVESIRQFVETGFDHLHLHQIGPDQAGFFRFWEAELRPAVTDAGFYRP
jgi:G6PDH family F420-dependent oxidoreductase